jgi:hypothetical protein
MLKETRQSSLLTLSLYSFFFLFKYQIQRKRCCRRLNEKPQKQQQIMCMMGRRWSGVSVRECEWIFSQSSECECLTDWVQREGSASSSLLLAHTHTQAKHDCKFQRVAFALICETHACRPDVEYHRVHVSDGNQTLFIEGRERKDPDSFFHKSSSSSCRKRVTTTVARQLCSIITSVVA